MYHKKFLCINKEDMRIYGDFDSNAARLMQIQLVKCTGHSYCKSPSEITNFLKEKWMLFLYNEKNFDQSYYNEASLRKMSKLSWISVNTQWQ